MCEMLNMFVPVARLPAIEPVRGVCFSEGGELQRDFVRQFKMQRGTFLSGHNGSMCLCGFDDWDALYEVARVTLERENAPWLALIHFWSGDTYDLTTRELDPYETDHCTPVAVGEVVVLRPQAAEQRRHRRVVRRLSACVGLTVSLVLKGGRKLHGTLVDFDGESEVGHIGNQTFVAGQVLDVSAPPSA